MIVLKLAISDSLELVFNLFYAVNIVTTLSLHKVTKKGGKVIHLQVLKNTGFSI